MKHTPETVDKEILEKHFYIEDGELYRTYKYSSISFQNMDDTLVEDKASVHVTTGEYPLILNMRKTKVVMILLGISRIEAREVLNFKQEAEFSKWLRRFTKANSTALTRKEERLMSAAYHRRSQL